MLILQRTLTSGAIVALMCLASACGANSQGSPESGDATLEAQVDTVLGRFTKRNGPGFAIGIILRSELVIAKGYGLADIESGRPITVDTALNLASLSKQFTGAAVALEIGKGTMSLNDPLNRHWPDLPTFLHDVRIDHLIYMTSGIPEYYSLPSPRSGWSSEDRFTIDDAISAVFAAGALEYEPGTRWSYSNINYQLLAQLVARVAGRDFSEYLNESIFAPLNMSHSWVDAPLRTVLEYKATSYELAANGQWRVAPRLSPHFGGSGVFASINDLYKWHEALYHSESFGPEFRRQMLATRRFNHDKVNDAFGLVHGSYRDVRTIWYAGRDYGVSTYMARVPDYDTTIICLANFSSANCREIANQLLDLALEDSP